VPTAQSERFRNVNNGDAKKIPKSSKVFAAVRNIRLMSYKTFPDFSKALITPFSEERRKRTKANKNENQKKPVTLKYPKFK
jgi:hypothetical protein